MSRLYDRIMADGPQPYLFWDNNISSPTVVVEATEPVCYFADNKEGTSQEEIPCPLPPFEDCFVESALPFSKRPYLGDAFGIRMLTNRHSVSDDQPVAFSSLWNLYLEAQDYDGLFLGIRLNDLNRMSVPALRMGPVITWAIDYFSDGSTGEIYWDLSQHYRLKTVLMQTWLDAYQRQNTDYEKALDEFKRKHVTPYNFFGMFACSLMNAKNVELVDTQPSAGKSRKHERRTGVPLVSYKTIKVNPMRTEKHYPPEDTSPVPKKMQESNLPASIWRGHFKDYRDGKGLFGNPALKGVYWWDQHMRGSIENGININDYKVQAPNNKEEDE